MEGKWSLLAVGSFIIAAICFFKVAYLDIIFSLASIVFATKGFITSSPRYVYLIIIATSACLFVLAVFQLIVRTRELGYFPPLF